MLGKNTLLLSIIIDSLNHKKCETIVEVKLTESYKICSIFEKLVNKKLGNLSSKTF